jgi:hypothetical protein
VSEYERVVGLTPVSSCSLRYPFHNISERVKDVVRAAQPEHDERKQQHIQVLFVRTARPEKEGAS